MKRIEKKQMAVLEVGTKDVLAGRKAHQQNKFEVK